MRSDGAGAPSKVIAEFPVNAAATYKDSLLMPDQRYRYAVVAITTTGLRSKPSPEITVQAPPHAGSTGKFLSLEARRNKKSPGIRLQWKHDVKDVSKIEVYRNEIGKKPALLKTLKGFEDEMTDATAVEKLRYEYLVRIVLYNGRYGPYIKTVTR